MICQQMNSHTAHRSSPRAAAHASENVDFSFGFDEDSGYQPPVAHAESRVPAPEGSDPRLWAIASSVNDPEIPVLSIADLGILRATYFGEDGTPTVVITPTYSGCPAMGVISSNLVRAFTNRGLEQPVIETALHPAWTTDWMSEDGKAKLREYGIAPPTGATAAGPTSLSLGVKCPRCHSLNTREMTRFGSTSCKALYQCASCKEPFDYFKVH